MATAATVQAILAALPGFTYSGAAATLIDDHMLADVVADHPDDPWGAEKANLAAALLLAHRYSVMARGGSGQVGPMVSSSAGGVSQTFQGPYALANESELRQTPYGIQYLELRSRVTVTPLVM